MPPKKKPPNPFPSNEVRAAKISCPNTNIIPPKYFCNYPYCQHHRKPFFCPQDYLHHLTTGNCTAKLAQLRCFDQILDNQKTGSQTTAAIHEDSSGLPQSLQYSVTNVHQRLRV